MKIKILLLLFFISGLARAQEKIPHFYTWGIGWPLSSPLLDTVKHNEFSQYKKNKVKEILTENEASKSREVMTVNKEGYITSSINYDEDTKTEEFYFEYNEQNLMTGYGVKKYMRNGTTENMFFKIDYKEGLPISSTYEDSSRAIRTEALYENGKLVKIKTKISMQGFEIPKIEDVVITGDTVKKINPVSKTAVFEIITIGNTIKTGGESLTYKTEFLENYRVVKEESKNWVRKYFYKENGLIDYVLQTIQGKEKKLIYKYTYYED